jgi:hypothetical protein
MAGPREAPECETERKMPKKMSKIKIVRAVTQNRKGEHGR